METIESDATSDETGVLLIERAPFGTINAIAPTTNPTSTVINNAIIMVSAGNAVVFSPHPNAARCSLRTMTYLNDAIVEAGGPRNLLTSVASPSLRHAKVIMEHEGIDVICATGGSAVVRVALTAGKKAFAAGPGNPPAVVDESADVGAAAQALIDGASFDNNLLCIGEKSCFMVDSIAEDLLRRMASSGGHLVRSHELPRLVEAVSPGGKTNADLIGKDAAVILDAAGIRATRDARVVLVETDAEHALVMDEFLMPVLPCVRVKTFEEAVVCAAAAEGGRGHTATLHTMRLDRIRTFARALQVGVLVVNGPSFASAGIGGPGFLAMTVAGRTGEGFTTPRHFTTERRTSLIGAVSMFGSA
jgi:propionaldehyde dehydrogenase